MANRREFLRTAGLTGTALLSSAAYSQVVGANERFVVGVIGCGGMGSNHVRLLAGQRDVTIAHLCDVDSGRSAAAAKSLPQDGRPAPALTADLRRVLDDRGVEAVFIATPDHWHAPATILAVNAGKHVYVEKPCCHNIREGRLMIEAARRQRKVVQVGTQSRSTEHVRTAMQMLREGAIGEVLVAKAWNSQLRRNIGRGKPGTPPANLDYDTWIGPAPMVPYQANRLHYNWHWWHDFGTGDFGNDGVHDIDIARWGLGVETHPSSVAALGGKYSFDDDQQFPDTQYVAFEYPNGDKKKMLIFEQRIWSPYSQEGFENGNAFYGTRGMMILGKGGGWRLFAERNKEVRAQTGTVDLPANQRNFLTCIRSGARPNADIEINHLSSTLCHLGNIATRVRRVLNFNPETEEIHNDKEASPMVRRDYRDGHWAVPQGV